MRCLYCGKELALLKRWTGGGEFCSDAHRQQYQEEYNQLALNRLLQAKPVNPAKIADRKAEPPAPLEVKTPPASEAPKPPATTPAAATPAVTPAVTLDVAETPRAIPAREPEPEVAAAETALEAAVEDNQEPAPAAGGFLIEIPAPVDGDIHVTANANGAFDWPAAPQLPGRSIAAVPGELVLAVPLVLSPSIRVWASTMRAGDRGLELREFVRSAPVFHFDAHCQLAAGETTFVERSEESMDILFFPHPPQSSPPLWQEGAAPFTLGFELGSLARTAFRTTGIDDTSDGLEPMPVEAAEEQIAGKTPVQLAAQNVGQPIVAAPAFTGRQDSLKASPQAKLPAPPTAPSEAPAVPVISVRIAGAAPPAARTPVFRPLAASKPAEPAAPAAPAAPQNPNPAVVTRPLPLTLHGLAAGRGKPVQVFQAAVTGTIDVQTPRSSALPLRPVMTLGPAPAKTEERKPERAATTRTEPKEQDAPAARPDPRSRNGKHRQPDPPKSEPVPDAATCAKTEAAPEVPPVTLADIRPLEIKPIESKPETTNIAGAAPEPARSEPKLPEPLARPFTPVDLGLPKLALESNSMSVPARIAIAAAAVLFVSLTAFFVLRTGSPTVVAKGPQVVAGSPLPALESGWITDWGAEPGVRREHDISILRASLNLSDYRVEFHAQIDNKALGWVYRAKDGKNYYVSKLEIVTPGLEPVVAAVHYAVVDGQARPRSQTPLPMKVRLDTLYKIRFDAVGDHFTTYVQDQKVDEWSDDRFKMGGVGLFNERGERMSLAGSVNVVPLEIRR